MMELFVSSRIRLGSQGTSVSILVSAHSGYWWSGVKRSFLSRGAHDLIYTHTVWVRHFLLVACILCRFESAFCPFFWCYHTVAVNSVGSTLLYIYCIWGIEYGVTVKTSFLNLSRRADSNHVQYSYHTTMKKNDIFLYSIFSVFGIF